MRFSRSINNYFLYSSDFLVDQIVLYSKLLPDMVTLNLFMTNRLVYVNGFTVLSKSLPTYVGDNIQLIISK